MSGQDGAGVNGGPAAVAPYVGDTIYVAPLGGGLDDTARMNAVVAFWANKRKICALPTNWIFASQGVGNRGGVRVRPGTWLEITRGATWTSTQTSGAFEAFLIWGIPSLTGSQGTLTVATAVTTGAASNQLTISALGAIIVGDWIWVGQTNPGSIYTVGNYQVTNIAGLVLTVDRPVLWAFPIGTEVRIQTERVNDVTVICNEAVFTGGADRHVQLEGGFNCYLEGVNSVSSQAVALGADGYPWAYDIGSFQCVAARCTSYFMTRGWIIEGSERISVYDCNTRRSRDAGNTIRDSININLFNTSASDFDFDKVTAAPWGLQFGATTPTLHGCKQINVYGGRYSNEPLGAAFASTQVSYGVQILRSEDIHLNGVWCEGNLVNYEFDTLALRCSAVDCTSKRALGAAPLLGVGFYCNGPEIRLVNPTSIDDLIGLWYGKFQLNTVLDITNPNFSGAGYTYHSIKVDLAINSPKPIINIRGGCLLDGDYAVDIYGPATVLIDGTYMRVKGGVNGICVYHRASAVGGVAIMRGTTCAQSAANSFGYTSLAAALTLRLEGRNNFLTTNSVVINAAAFCNRAYVALNGAAAVVVPWPDLQPGECPALTRTTVAGGTGLAPLVALTPGTGFTVTGVGGDTDTYHYEISP